MWSHSATSASGILNVSHFNCPALTTLGLSEQYCAKSILDSFARLTPNVKRLEVSMPVDGPYTCLSHFKALRVLKFHSINASVSLCLKAFAFLPLLESLESSGNFFAKDLVMAHSMPLKSLKVIDPNGHTPTTIRGLSLEFSRLRVTGSKRDL